MLLPAVAALLPAAQILLCCRCRFKRLWRSHAPLRTGRRRCRFQRWRCFYAPLKSCFDAGAASSGRDASSRRSNPDRSQVPLQVAATLRRTNEILLGRRCCFQRWRRSAAQIQWPRRFYAPVKSCSDAAVASNGDDASTRRSNPARAKVPLYAAAARLRAAQILLGPSLGTFLLLHHGPSLIYK